MSGLAIYDLTCNYQTNPLGLGDVAPQLAWKLRSPRQGVRQSAYQVRVARDAASLAGGGQLLWDSGRVESDRSVQVDYAGPAPGSGERAYWQVQVWDDAGNDATSDVAWWEMGLRARENWDPAQWIGGSLVGGVWTSIPLPYLRKTFKVQGEIATARLFVTALGLYECTFNGQRVGKDWFTPGWTDYSKRVQYQVYDVTPLLRAGENVWGARLGDGWYTGNLMMAGRQGYGDRPKLFGKLVVTYADGKTQTVVTDGQWQTRYGAMLAADNYNGESFDARLEPAGWDTPGAEDKDWQPVQIFDDPGIALSESFGSPVRVMQELTPVAPPVGISNFISSRWVFDFGQNMVGRVRLKVNAAAGTTLRLRFAEVLNPDGTIYTQNLRAAQQTDNYTCRGGGEEIWEPRFTFHGFRYVELSGYPGTPPEGMLTGVVMHSDTPPTGTFECSEPLLNQLQHNIEWGQKGNFFDVPTDCPQRDERLGWTGDAQVFIRTAAFNMDVAPFFWKWLRDVADAQSPRGAYPPVAPLPHDFMMTDGGPAWAEAGVICPWTLYLVYGDTRILERQYASMQKFIQFLEATSEDGIRPVLQPDVWVGFGDWLSLDVPPDSDSVLFGWDGGTPKQLIGTAFYAYATKLMAQIAQLLGRSQDVTTYQKEFERVRAAFQKTFVDEEGCIQGNTQTAYTLALYFDLLPPELRANAVDRLVNLISERGMHLATGFVGTPYLNQVLTDGGRVDVAYALLLQQTYPSWLFPVLNGATTIWERWDGWTTDRGFQNPEMNSFNHYAYGAIGNWLYTTVAGIDANAAQPGYKHIILHPHPGGSLTSAKATLESPYGKIESAWELANDVLKYDVVIPPNTTASVLVPVDGSTPVVASALGEGVLPPPAPAERSSHTARYELGAGTYHFESTRITISA